MGNSPPKRAAAVRDLERFTNPTGLYPTCPWDVRLVRRLIMEKRLAPRIPGRECCESVYTQECPICFMFYPGHLNMSTCCKKLICSECYLQLKPPKKIVSCPYCNRESFSITYVAPSPSAFSLSSLQSDPTSMRTPTPPIPVHATPNARSRANTANSVASHTSHTSSPQPDPSHFASVEDRERIRDDLRSQLQLTDQPIMTPPTRPSLLQSRRSSSGSNFIIASPQDAAMLAQPRYIIASANDAARLEEMMLMEAIRRSMRDLLPKEDEDEEGEDEDYQYSSSNSSSSGNDGSMDLIAGLEGRAGSDYDLLRPYQATAGSNRP